MESHMETLMEAMTTVRESKKVQCLKKDRLVGMGGGKCKSHAGQTDFAKRAARDRIQAAKAKSTCNFCQMRGHWAGDLGCPTYQEWKVAMGKGKGSEAMQRADTQ